MTNAALLLIGLAVVAFVSWYIRHRRGGTGYDYDAAQLHEAIAALAALSDQLENADTMIADLAACNPRELLRGFRAQWCGIDGRRRHIDFIADGSNGTTDGLKRAARDQRNQINTEIIETIRAISAALDAGDAPALHLDAVEKTVEETADAAAAGEW